MMNTILSLRSLVLAVALLLGASIGMSQQGPVLPQPAVTPGVPGVPGAVPAPSPAATYAPARMIEMKPEMKRPLIVKASERNPYARRAPGQEEVGEDGENQEEIEIRETLTSLPISGRSQGNRGLRILLGDMILERGTVLPQLVPEQSENLRVVEVDEESVIFAWLDVETGEPTGKTLQIGYDLTPSVTYSLAGQVRRGEGGEAVAERRMGVLRIGQERKVEAARMAAKDPSRELPREVYEAGQ